MEQFIAIAVAAMSGQSTLNMERRSEYIDCKAVVI